MPVRRCRRSPGSRSRSRTCSTSPAKSPPRLEVLADAPPAAADAPPWPGCARAGAALIGPHQHDRVRVLGRRHQSAPTARRPMPATLALDPAPRIPGGSTSGGARVGRQRRGLGGARARTPAARSASRPRCRDSSASRTPRGSCRPRVRCRCRRRSTRSAPSPDRCATPSCCTRCWPRARVQLAGRPLDALAPRGAAHDHARRPRRRGRARVRAQPRGAAPRRRAHRRRSTCAARRELAAINATGGFAAAESWAWHRRWLAEREATLRPARRAAHPARRVDERGRLHRPARRAARLDRPHGGSARGLRCAALADRAHRRPAARAADRDDDAVLRRQRAAAAQPLHRQPARRLRALPALPRRRRIAGRADGLVQRPARRRRARRRPGDRSRTRRRGRSP